VSLASTQTCPGLKKQQQQQQQPASSASTLWLALCSRHSPSRLAGCLGQAAERQVGSQQHRGRGSKREPTRRGRHAGHLQASKQAGWLVCQQPSRQLAGLSAGRFLPPGGHSYQHAAPACLHSHLVQAPSCLPASQWHIAGRERQLLQAGGCIVEDKMHQQDVNIAPSNLEALPLLASEPFSPLLPLTTLPTWSLERHSSASSEVHKRCGRPRHQEGSRRIRTALY